MTNVSDIGLNEDEVTVFAAIADLDATRDATKERILSIVKMGRIPLVLVLRRLHSKGLTDGFEDPIYVTDKGWKLIESNIERFLACSAPGEGPAR